MSELHIPEEALFEAKIQKISAGAHDAKGELARVQFELHMKIIELELKSQPLTPLELREQCKATVKEGIATVDAVVADYTMLFEQAMEVVMSLQEDPTCIY